MSFVHGSCKLLNVDAKGKILNVMSNWRPFLFQRQERSFFNLKKHYKAKHITFEGNFLAALAGNRKRCRSHSGQDKANIKRRQASIETALKQKFNQKEAQDLYYR